MKRFYRDVSVVERDGGWCVALDGRPIRTQGGALQVLPGAALAEALATEWAAQGKTIDPKHFVFRDLADHAIDAIAPDPARCIAALVAYAETDTLCYRADPEEPLAERQRAVWEPILTRFEARHGVSFRRVSGIIHRPQAPETLGAMRALLLAHNAFALAALTTLTSLAASLVIGLTALDGDADTLWHAANLEEDWQADLWGRDEEAEARRAHRRGQFLAAARFVTLAR